MCTKNKKIYFILNWDHITLYYTFVILLLYDLYVLYMYNSIKIIYCSDFLLMPRHIIYKKII